MNNCSDGKLQTYRYSKVKLASDCEKYLKSIRNFELRRSIYKFRVPSHHLQIELGRYNVPGYPLTPKAVNSAVQEKLKMKYIFFSTVLNMNQTEKNWSI
jgi:hypothetical protein